jgi:hypothetical protein
MTSFEKMGEAQILAQEGQRQIAVAIGGLVSRGFLFLIEMISRNAPGPFVP